MKKLIKKRQVVIKVHFRSNCKLTMTLRQEIFYLLFEIVKVIEISPNFYCYDIGYK